MPVNDAPVIENQTSLATVEDVPITIRLEDLVVSDIDNPDYPNIVADYRRTYATLQALPCDVFLGAHGRWFDLPARRARIAAGDRDAFVAPEACRAFLAESRAAFEAEAARQGVR